MSVGSQKYGYGIRDPQHRFWHRDSVTWQSETTCLSREASRASPPAPSSGNTSSMMLCAWPDHNAQTHIRFKEKEKLTFRQCWGSVTFWCRSESRSADPYL
jgi:hypothetical protein